MEISFLEMDENYGFQRNGIKMLKKYMECFFKKKEKKKTQITSAKHRDILVKDAHFKTNSENASSICNYKNGFDG